MSATVRELNQQDAGAADKKDELSDLRQGIVAAMTGLQVAAHR